MKEFLFTLLVFGFSLFLPTGMAQYIELPPYEVQNVQATVDGDMIRVTWDETEDQGGGVVIGYKLYYGKNSVTADSGNSYDDDISIDSINTNYTLRNLEPGTYYLAVTARDDEDGESVNYSIEVSVTVDGTTTPPLDNFETGTPKVLSATQVASGTVQVQMSEPVVIENVFDGFVLQHKESLGIIPIIRVDTESNFVFLTVQEGMLTNGEVFQVIATAFVEDLEGNPVSSGITDTAEFTARLVVIEESLSTPEPFTPPSTEVLELPDVGELFEEKMSEVVSDPPFIEEVQAELFEEQVQDTTPPYDATNFQVDLSTMITDLYVTLNWEKSLDVDSDTTDQILYARVDNGEWDTGYSIGKDLEEIELDIELGYSYEVKIVTVDERGNVSSGSVLAFTTIMPLAKTGSELYFILILGFGILGMGGFMLLQKRNRLY